MCVLLSSCLENHLLLCLIAFCLCKPRWLLSTMHAFSFPICVCQITMCLLWISILNYFLHALVVARWSQLAKGLLIRQQFFIAFSWGHFSEALKFDLKLSFAYYRTCKWFRIERWRWGISAHSWEIMSDS